jgi:hypothetical protein
MRPWEEGPDPTSERSSEGFPEDGSSDDRHGTRTEPTRKSWLPAAAVWPCTLSVGAAPTPGLWSFPAASEPPSPATRVRCGHGEEGRLVRPRVFLWVRAIARRWQFRRYMPIDHLQNFDLDVIPECGPTILVIQFPYRNIMIVLNNIDNQGSY